MSFTSTLETTKTTGSVFLTPSKRKRVDREQEQPKLPSTSEIWKWIFQADAVASCFICDIRAMKIFKEKEYEFWWLNKIPCRSVRIVGMIVGVQPYEKRISYLVDDGTSVIECVHRCRPPSPTKDGSKKKHSVNDPPMPIPIAWIGATVQITGRIQEFGTKQKHDMKEIVEARRQIIVESIEKCKSANAKLHHWQTVLNLHKTYYSSSEPFSIPDMTANVSTTLVTQDPRMSPSVTSTPSTSTTSSPARSISHQQSSRKLRHPSRLHTADLTGNTFRIYIKHYMDNFPLLGALETETDTESESESSADGFVGLSTPSRRISCHISSDETPRRHVCVLGDERTPRAMRRLANPFSPAPQNIDPHSPQACGFTLSYLRRVPELSDMARRVVKAEAKRRDREARKKAKETASSQSRTSRTQTQDRSWAKSVASTAGSGSKDTTSTAARMKRLWKWAIVQLLQEGSIVIWSGPKYQLSSSHSSSSGLWKLSSSNTSASMNSTTVNTDISLVSANTSGHRTQTVDEDETIDLSDPELDEECYISLTPELLAGEVERIIRVLATRSSSRTAHKPTKEGILALLRRDDRWMRVGEWNVEEALEVLRVSGRAFEAGRGLWSVVIS